MNEKSKKSLTRLALSVLVIALILLAIYFLFKALGITELTREQIQDFISSTGAVAPLVFIGISFLQVTFVPIPGMVTILAGNYLFGIALSFLYSYVGMLIGSIVAWWLGRLIGRPYVNWVAGGSEQADEWLKRLKGREKVFLFFAFLLPLFPDDLLCSVAGILPISFSVFMIMQIITRATSIGASLLFMSGEIIPFHGWGLVVLGVVAVLIIIAFILSLKYADKINAYFDNFINKITKNKHRN
ncbi:MAG: TVP38/TMEM64 family protein [Clostridia bacterium]|nr:TVP38/TMEM64 family protein [Clostridia bacterium]